MTQDLPGGSYLKLKINFIMPKNMPIDDIGHKNNARGVLYFIAREDVGITKAGIIYLSKYHGQFSIVSIRLVARPLLISKIFGYVNEVDSHKKYRQSDLALTNYLVNQCGWLRLCTAVPTGITMSN